MFFNSVEFAFFLPLVFLLYWLIGSRRVKGQNAFLVVASYVFYGLWDWRFLSLIAFSSIVDYLVGLGMGRTDVPRKRRILLAVSICVNLGFLGFFKYFNFFSQRFADVFSLFGDSFDPVRLNIILPVGISFYTFQTLSYSIDVYRRRLEPINDGVAFFAFVSYFPQLVAGPIERASNLLPQFQRQRCFSYQRAVDGLRQILWGLVKKVVIADSCALYVNEIFNHSSQLSGSTILLGAILFSFQIYGDFSGYSDIAIGSSRLFGFELMRNFAYPYFSRDVAEFWRRWHISLSTWFRDYLYIPLGGSRGSVVMRVRNIFIIFIVSGFWHGANWTFIAWGAAHACFFLPLLLLNKNRVNLKSSALDRALPGCREIFQMVTTFLLISLAWIFFRAVDIRHAFACFAKIFSPSLFTPPAFRGMEQAGVTLFLLVLFLAMEWFGRDWEYAVADLGLRWPRGLRWAFYYLLVAGIFYSSGRGQEFIYFQF